MTLKALLLCMILAVPFVQKNTLKFPLAGDVDEVMFDSAKVSADDLRRWMQLSPRIGNYNRYLIPENIADCFADDPRYIGCGKEQEKINPVNAQLNLRKVRDRIDSLDPSRFPPDLSQVVSYVKQLQQFALWMQNRELEFAKTREPSALETSYFGVDPKASCAHVLDRIHSAKSPSEADKIARFDWQNCVWFAYKDKIGPYPEASWNTFLSKYGIDEKVKEEPPIE